MAAFQFNPWNPGGWLRFVQWTPPVKFVLGTPARTPILGGNPERIAFLVLSDVALGPPVVSPFPDTNIAGIQPATGTTHILITNWDFPALCQYNWYGYSGAGGPINAYVSEGYLIPSGQPAEGS